MPTSMDAMLGLVVVALGVLSWIVSFGLTDAKKRALAYGLAGLITLVGGFYYVSSEMRGFEMRRRLAQLQRQQDINLSEIQQRLQKVQQGQEQNQPASEKSK